MIRTLILAAALAALLVSACSVQTVREDATQNGALSPAPGEAVVLSATLENDTDATEDPPPPPTSSTRTSTTTSTSTTTTTTTTTTTVPLPAPLPPVSEPSVASESEPYADAKTIAGQIAQRLLTYDPDTSHTQLAAEVVTADDQIPELVEAIQPAVHGGLWSRATVVYPQLGGLTDDRMSVMVVVRQQFGDDDEPDDTVTRTMDVRLMKSDGEWVFEGLASAGGDLAPRPADLSDLAVTVVDHPNIILSDSARWDIYRGWISNDLLRLMLDLGDESKYYVLTLTSGHPHNVFGTDTMSRHTSGHAVDLYRIADARVVDDRAEASATRKIVAEWCTRDDVSSIGSPWTFENEDPAEGSEESAEEPVSEFTCRSFTDRVHQDHIHISVTPPAS